MARIVEILENSPFQQADTKIASGTIIKAIDGDSIKVRFPSDLLVEVRLLSIECPEHGQPLSDDAVEFTRRFVEDRPLTLGLLFLCQHLRGAFARVLGTDQATEQAQHFVPRILTPGAMMMTLQQAAQILDAQLFGAGDVGFESVSTDGRSIKAGACQWCHSN